MKKLMTVLAMGALVLSMSGVSSALDLNVYGASAQFNFWSAEAITWMESAAGGGCTPGTSTQIASGWSPADNTPANVYYHGAKYYIAQNVGPCTLDPAGITVRVASYDSDDGIQAALGNTNILDVNKCQNNERTQLISVAGGKAPANLNCYPTILGSADVNGLTVVQQTEGNFDGTFADPVASNYLTGAQVQDQSGAYGGFVNLQDFTSPADWILPANGPTVATCNGTGTPLIDHHPVVVPFGFWANKDITAADGGKLQTALTNMTTGMAQQIFGQGVTDWSDFGFPAGPISICLRVAGSGTYATLDAAVMRTNGFPIGGNLPTADNSILANNVYFNNTSSDMMHCIDSTPGAIGIADADQNLTTSCSNGVCANTWGPVNFNGAQPSATNIQNGLYDRLWTLEHIFEPDAALKAKFAASYLGGAYPQAAVNNFVTFTDSNIPASKANYWVNSKNMKFHKLNDFTYPPVAGPYNPDPPSCYE